MFPWNKSGQIERAVYRALDNQSLTNTISNRAVRPIPTPTKVAIGYQVVEGDDVIRIVLDKSTGRTINQADVLLYDQNSLRWHTLIGPFALNRGRANQDVDDVYIKLFQPMEARAIAFKFYAGQAINNTLTEIRPNYGVQLHHFPYYVEDRKTERITQKGYWVSKITQGKWYGVFMTLEQVNQLDGSQRTITPAFKSTAGIVEYTKSKLLEDDDVVDSVVALLPTKSGSYTWTVGNYCDGDHLYIGGPVTLGNS